VRTALIATAAFYVGSVLGLLISSLCVAASRGEQ